MPLDNQVLLFQRQYVTARVPQAVCNSTATFTERIEVGVFDRNNCGFGTFGELLSGINQAENFVVISTVKNGSE